MDMPRPVAANARPRPPPGTGWTDQRREPGRIRCTPPPAEEGGVRVPSTATIRDVVSPVIMVQGARQGGHAGRKAV